MTAARDARTVMWDPRRFWFRRGRPTDAPDLAVRLAVRPKGWAEHAFFWPSVFLGALIVLVGATADIKEPLALLALLVLGLYFMWSGWSVQRHGYSLKDRVMLLFGEAVTTATMAAAAVVLVRWVV